MNSEHTPRHTKKPFHEAPCNPTQNPLSASDQHKPSKVNIGSSTSTQDATSNDVPLTLSPYRHALSIACMRLPTLTTGILLLIFDLLGNPIPYGDTPDDDNENDSGDLTGVEEYNNQTDIPGVATPDQEEIPGVTTPEEEEEIQEVDILEEEDENTEITGVDQNIEDPGVNHTTGTNNAMPENPTGPIPTKNINMPKVETVDESDAEEEETESKGKIQDKEGFEFQVNSPSPAERRIWEASQRHGLRPHWQPSFEQKHPSDYYTNLMVHVLTQLNLKKGLKTFGDEGIKATKSEMKKMHDKVVFHPIRGEELTGIQKQEAL